MKRFLCFLLVLLLATPVVTVHAADTVTATSTGFTDVLFSNGYRGFCLDRDKDGAYTNDTFATADNTSAATSNIDSSDISQLLKALFTQSFATVFTADGNGGYKIANTSTVQAVIWHFTEGQYVWGTQKTLADAAKAYNGPAIPDEGYQLTLDNGDVVTFYFMVMEPQNADQQAFFAYKLSVGQEAPHQHDYSDKWETSDDEHWHECDCGDKTDVTEHEPTIINQKDAKEFEEGYSGDTVCEICEKELKKGEVIPPTHQHDYSDKWETSDDEHWHECDCGDKTDVEEHEPTLINQKDAKEFEEGYSGDTICEVCEKELKKGEVIPPTHQHEYSDKWETSDDEHWHECDCGDKTDVEEHDPVVVNKKDAKEFEEGYTGDTICEICEKELKKGEVIPPTHQHDYSDKWETSDDEHWHECDCGDKTDVEEHEPTVINQKDAKEFEEGYTGDTICEICEKELKKGEVIPATHQHDYSDKWETSDDEHWHECDCGDKTDVEEHEPTLINQKDAKEFEEGYSGDTVCETCEILLKTGVVIPETHKHVYSEKWESDEDTHWHKCDCGDKSDTEKHTPTVVNKKAATQTEEGYTGDTVCETCEKLLEEGQVIDRQTTPGTGDPTPIYLWLTLCLLSLAGCWVTLCAKKKHAL